MILLTKNVLLSNLNAGVDKTFKIGKLLNQLKLFRKLANFKEAAHLNPTK